MKSRLAHWRGRFWFVALGTYMIVSIPIVAVFLRSEYVRFVYLETVTHWYSKIAPIKYVFIGDSITAAGRNWGIRLSINPLSARNLGVSGYTIRQVHDLVSTALTYRPKYIVVTAGTNDVLRMSMGSKGKTNSQMDDLAREYEQMLDDIICGGATPIVTLVPYTTDDALNGLVTLLNSRILTAAQLQELPVVDLNARIAPNNALLSEYSQDGVHLSDRAYDVWTQEILKTIAGKRHVVDGKCRPTRQDAKRPQPVHAPNADPAVL